MTSTALQAAPQLVLTGQSIGGTARLLSMVLGEKTVEASWKQKTLTKVARGVVCIHATDRDERVYLEDSYGDVAIRGRQGMPPRVVIRLDSVLIPQVLSLREGPLHLPALWAGSGRTVTRALLTRKIVVKGLLLHPVLTVRVLQLLSVPPSG